MSPDPTTSTETTRSAALRVVPVPADLDSRVEYRRAITRVLRLVPDVALCESCGRRPAVEVVPALDTVETLALKDARPAATAQPFRVCADCTTPTPPATTAPSAVPPRAAAAPAVPVRPVRSRLALAGERVTIVSADPAGGSDPRDPAWAGTVRIRRRGSELVWPAVFCLAGPVSALNAWLLSGNPVVMVATGVCTFAGVVAVDHRRDRRNG